MRSVLALLAALAVAASPATGAVRVVLDDGDVIRGLTARRERDRLVIVVDSRETVSVPARRVIEVRTLEEGRAGATGAPTGIVRAEPTQLAGPAVEPATPHEQAAVLGEPARFPGETAPRKPFPRAELPGDPTKENNFAPSSWAQAPIDPRWTPASGLPSEGESDPSRTSRPSPAPEWQPADAWSAQRAVFGTSVLARLEVALGGVREKVETCARRIVRADPDGPAQGTRVEVLDGRPWAALPIRLYAVERRSGGQPRRTIFAIEGDVCRPLAGDLPAAAGVGFPPGTTVRNYNRALQAAALPLPKREPVAEALAIATLADPSVMGASRDRLVPLGSATDLERQAATEPIACQVSAAARRRIQTLATEAVAPPQVEVREGARVVRFWTWSPRGGVLARHVLRTSASGTVTLESDEVAQHLGDHRDPEVRLASR